MHHSLLSQQQETADGTEGGSEELFANGTFVQLQSTVYEFCEECHRLQTSPPAVECLLELPVRCTTSSLELAADLVGPCVYACYIVYMFIVCMCV